ncbi:hypothetical protein [uncultured Chryseobacterium sp.]|uniref:hypothetical protein n=1 Tax=uncultured Chryseobacterium sp. TaxID=259322 RepID=UPI001A5B86AD|nr:hypothetical protein [uncultured Chryseobacterium sp.]MBL7880137.1 hypothetical protein [Chryseobacterium gambrini]
MKTRILLLFLLWAGMFLGQRRATIKQLKLFTDVHNTKKTAGGITITKDSISLQPTLFWAQYDASRRGSMLYIDKNQRVRMLSENPPDVAIQSITEISAKVKGLKGDVGEAEAAFKAQKSIAELGKRTAAVNMLRDALYRLNELYYATADEKKEILEVLQSFAKSNAEKLNAENIKAFSSSSIFTSSIESNDLRILFSKVIDNVKEIAVEEAKTDVYKFQAEKSENEFSTEKAKAETKKYEAMISIIQKMEGSLSKDEVDNYLKKIINEK